jgi:hypothetical protein
MQRLAVSLIAVSSVGAVRRMLEEKDDDDSMDFIGLYVALGVVLCCALTCTYQTISKRMWIDELRTELESEMKVAQTAKGQIEYKLWGEAPYMLFMPGTPAFGHCSVGIDKYFPGLITVSRPGNGRTPLTEELKKSSAQADLIMALMDHLNIEKLPIMVGSGSGVIGIRMALQYPDRIQALCT